MPPLPDTAAVETHIVEMTNAFRRKQNLKPVRLNAALSKAAEAYGRYLAASKTFSHTADGRQPADRAAASGYAYCQVGENLAMALDSRGFQSRALAKQTVEGWINSPGHRENLVLPFVRDIGIAVVKAPDTHPKYISVQLFGRAKSEMYKFQVSNSTGKPVTYQFGDTTQTIDPRYSFTHEACTPSALVFETFGGRKPPPKVKTRYDAKDGQVYTLETTSNGTLDIKVSARETLP